MNDLDPTDADPTDADRPGPRFGARASGVAAYLGMAVTELSDGTEPLALLRGPFPAPAHITDADGRTPTGVLAALVDSISGLSSGIAALPGWIVTTNLTLRRGPAFLTGPHGAGPLQLDTEVLRRGRSAIITRTAVTSADGSAVATGWMTAAVLAPTGGPPDIGRPIRPTALAPTDDAAFTTPPEQFFALRPGTGPGEVVLDIVERLRNPWGIVHGGAMAVLVDTAAARAAAAAASPDATTSDPGSGPGSLEPTAGWVTTDLVLHYLSPGRVGPVVAVPRVLGRRGSDSLVRVTVRDHGADDRLLVEAVVTVRHVD